MTTEQLIGAVERRVARLGDWARQLRSTADGIVEARGNPGTSKAELRRLDRLEEDVRDVAKDICEALPLSD